MRSDLTFLVDMKDNPLIGAPLWLRIGGARRPILPWRGIFVLACVGVGMVALAFLVEFQLAYFSSRGQIASEPWSVENGRINSENFRKMRSTDKDPVFRSTGYAPPAPAADRKRILVIGDSFIWGDGVVNLNMIWWRQLQWELERRGYSQVDVIAAGVNGASTQDQYRWIFDEGLVERTRPDAIVFGYVTNDPQMKDADGRDLVRVNAPQKVELAIQGWPFGTYLPNLAHEIAGRMAKKREQQQNGETGYSYNEWELKILEGENFRRYQDLLGRLAARVGELQVPLFFVTTPNAPIPSSFEQRYRPIRSAFAQAGLPLYDLLPPLVECCAGDVGQLVWGTNPANGHPGPRMTHFYADRIATILEQRYPQVLGPRGVAGGAAPAINDWMPASLAPKPVGAGEWAFEWPKDVSRLLRMPVGEPHVAIGFERPVTIRSLALSGAAAGRVKVWATVLDEAGNYERHDYVLLGQAAGPNATLALDGALAGLRVTSLRIAIDSREGPPPDAVALDPARFVRNEGKAWYVPLAGAGGPPDTSEQPTQSTLVLFEDGVPLATPHALHADIRGAGGGRYSHWQDGLLFSSSDGSDPTTNGRRYAWSRMAGSGDAVRLSIDFGTPAVKL